METAIKKAIEGGWQPTEPEIYWKNEELKTDISSGDLVCDPDFWKSLEKSIPSWKENTDYNNELYRKSGGLIPMNKLNSWYKYAIKFHEINLTQGWDKAVEWLLSVVESK